jgi:XTP/dITP diphosphohydrolase
MKLVLATRNPDKIKEIKSILKDTNHQLIPQEKIVPKLIVVETERSLDGNARKKALLTMRATKLSTLGEDTGLEVNALGGEPGVRSARYAGLKAKYEKNVKKLLKKMQSIPNKQRQARFRTVFALAIPGKPVHYFQGICSGKIAKEPIGKNGFGYDPIFIPRGFQLTFGQISTKTKNRISHRAKALIKVKEFLKKQELNE